MEVLADVDVAAVMGLMPGATPVVPGWYDEFVGEHLFALAVSKAGAAGGGCAGMQGLVGRMGCGQGVASSERCAGASRAPGKRASLRASAAAGVDAATDAVVCVNNAASLAKPSSGAWLQAEAMEAWQEAHERRTGRRPATPPQETSVRAARAAKEALRTGGGLLGFPRMLMGCAGRVGPAHGARPAPLPGTGPARCSAMRLRVLTRIDAAAPPACPSSLPIRPMHTPRPETSGEVELLVDPESAAWAPAGSGMRRSASTFFSGAVAEGDEDYAHKFGHYK